MVKSYLMGFVISFVIISLTLFSGCIDSQKAPKTTTTILTPTTSDISRPSVTIQPPITPNVILSTTSTTTSTTTPTNLPPTKPQISITSPKEGDVVSSRYFVEGTSDGVYGSNFKIWVLVYPIEAGGPYWVQPEVDILPNGKWESNGYFGRDPPIPEDSGKHFKITAIITTANLKEGQTFDKVPDNIYRVDVKAVRK